MSAEHECLERKNDCLEPKNKSVHKGKSIHGMESDASNSREYNLKLSQLRADAIRAALIKPFGIKPASIEAVGLGEEQLLNRNPEAAANRRVQLINIGKLGSNAECPHHPG